jgi:hypothetical protein
MNSKVLLIFALMAGVVGFGLDPDDGMMAQFEVIAPRAIPTPRPRATPAPRPLRHLVSHLCRRLLLPPYCCPATIGLPCTNARCALRKHHVLPKVDRLLLKTMPNESPKAQISGSYTAFTLFNALRTTRSTLTLQASQGWLGVWPPGSSRPACWKCFSAN